MKSVLVTGPVEHLDEYASAARRAGWDAREFALLRVEPRAFVRADLSRERFDWICVASGSALPWLRAALEAVPGLREARTAVVGPRTAEGARALGLELGLEPCVDASDLVASVHSREKKGASILCPRGDRSGDLSRALLDAGFAVDAPLAYANLVLERPEPAPASTAVFFASPSAVRAWHACEGSAERSPARRIAIAIGRTTFDALLEETPAGFFDTISLPEPTPEAFATVLAHLDIS